MQYAVSTQPQPSAPRYCTVFEIMAFIEARNHLEQHTCKWKVCVHVFACWMILAQSYRSFCLHGTGLLPSFLSLFPQRNCYLSLQGWCVPASECNDQQITEINTAVELSGAGLPRLGP